MDRRVAAENEHVSWKPLPYSEADGGGGTTTLPRANASTVLVPRYLVSQLWTKLEVQEEELRNLRRNTLEESPNPGLRARMSPSQPHSRPCVSGMYM